MFISTDNVVVCLKINKKKLGLKLKLVFPFLRQSVSDRFYQALYAKLLDPSLKTSSKQVSSFLFILKNLKCFLS